MARPRSLVCPSGHLVYGENCYKRNRRRYCRECHRLREQARRVEVRAFVEQRTTRWLADLPAIIAKADQLASRPGHP